MTNTELQRDYESYVAQEQAAGKSSESFNAWVTLHLNALDNEQQVLRQQMGWLQLLLQRTVEQVSDLERREQEREGEK